MISTRPTSTLALSTRESGFTWADTVEPERQIYVLKALRTLAVPSEPEYTVTIPAVQRTVKIPADRDTMTVGEYT